MKNRVFGVKLLALLMLCIQFNLFAEKCDSGPPGGCPGIVRQKKHCDSGPPGGCVG